jgi:hypothetical protein
VQNSGNRPNSFSFAQQQGPIKYFSQEGPDMKTRVLLVDDEEQFVDALSERLAIRDYEMLRDIECLKRF